MKTCQWNTIRLCQLIIRGRRCIHFLLVTTVYWTGLTILLFYLHSTRHHVISGKETLHRKHVRDVTPMADVKRVVAMPVQDNVSDNWEYEDVIIWNETKPYRNIQIAPFVNLEVQQGL